jgi:hypothetical protein
MTQQQLTEYNLGKSLDALMHLDPRGYGVCTILHEAASGLAKGPLSFYAARRLAGGLQRGGLVYIITGFVLHPYGKAETDGPVGAAALARALSMAFDAKPLFIVPEEAVPAVRKLIDVMGLRYCADPGELRETSLGAGIHVFVKDEKAAPAEAEKLMARGMPSYGIAIEAPGANERGVYHNAAGLDVSALEAKSDLLFDALRKAGVPALAIGDLGNECGMGALKDTLLRYIPYAAPGRCSCGCGGGIAARTSADTVVTATVSNWGAYGIIAALAYLTRKPEILHTAEREETALAAAAERGLIDMYGEQIPAVDGLDMVIIKSMVTLMKECVTAAFAHEEKCKTWFAKILELGFFETGIK